MTAAISPGQDVGLAAAVERIVARGLWCTLEVSWGAEPQWECALIICRRRPEGVVDAVLEWIDDVPDLDARLGACRRDTLENVPAEDTLVCYRADRGPTPLLLEAVATAAS